MSDSDIEDESERIHTLAVLHDLDSESLGVRAEKLVNVLRSPKSHGLYTIEGNKLRVDGALLEFAATAEVDNSNAALPWPPHSGIQEA